MDFGNIFETVLQYIITYAPVVLALLSEVGVVKYALNMLTEKMKEVNEYKALVQQNKDLLEEIRETKKLNRELLTKIDRIKRDEE